MGQLYEWMKAALAHFNLSFHDMDKVEVRFDPNKSRIIFIYGDQEVSYKMSTE